MPEILYDRLTRDQLHAYCLVLDAFGLSYTAEATAQGGRIMVEPQTYDTARDLVQQYIRENAESAPAFAAPAAAPHPQKTYSAFWICLVLLAAHVAIHSAEDVDAIVQAYGASAARIMQGELYRTVTALMIHADAAHLAGNIAGLAFLGTWAGRMAGPGLGWLAILLSGMIGNLANALFFKQGHLSIGASTAVFGALGFLAALHFQRKLKSDRPDERRKAWLPLAGGVALLGFMGTSVHSDLMAHLFGMAVGICLGLLYALGLQPHVQPRHQVWAMVVVTAIASLSWLRPI